MESDEPIREYDFCVRLTNGRAEPETIAPGWTSNPHRLLDVMEATRRRYPGAEVVLHISPWYWIDGKASCAGCDWAACPVGKFQDGEVVTQYA